MCQQPGGAIRDQPPGEAAGVGVLHDDGVACRQEHRAAAHQVLVDGVQFHIGESLWGDDEQYIHVRRYIARAQVDGADFVLLAQRLAHLIPRRKRLDGLPVHIRCRFSRRRPDADNFEETAGHALERGLNRIANVGLTHFTSGIDHILFVIEFQHHVHVVHVIGEQRGGEWLNAVGVVELLR